MMTLRMIYGAIFSLLCLGVSSQLAPVYNPGGGPDKIEVQTSSVRPKPRHYNTGRNKYITETVYGFLDFTTTVGSTVMVFTPQSEKEKKSIPTATRAPIISSTPTLTKIHTTKPPEIRKEAHIEPPTFATSTSTTISTTIGTTSAPSGLARLLQQALKIKSNPDEAHALTSRPLRNSYKKSEIQAETPALSRQRNFIPTGDRRKSFSGGSTIVPITIEGVGGAIPPRTPILEPSVYIPDEVVVSLKQNFPPISVIGPFNTEVNNAIENNYRYDHLASEPSPSIYEDYDLIDAESHTSDDSKPTGLVTTLGGTIISNGQTTVHKTSVIGTYVDGQYAQVLQSTSRIFKESSSDRLVTPTNSYETVKSVIEGSATQFFKPEATASLPLESLFSATSERNPRHEELRLESTTHKTKITKRRGTNPHEKDDYYYYDSPKDQFFDDVDYEDLIRSGSGPRPSFKSKSSIPHRSVSPSPVSNRKSQPSTYRPPFKPSATRNIPPSFLRNSPPPEKLRNPDRFRLPASSRPKLKLNRKPQTLIKEQITEETQLKYESNVKPTPSLGKLEETIKIVTSTPTEGPTDVFYEIATLRSLHTVNLGSTKNTRQVTYTKTYTHSIKSTPTIEHEGSEKSTVYEEAPLFENILENDKSKEIATLPPIDLNGRDLNSILQTLTETFQTTETMYKTSVLPVRQEADLFYHTLTQTYLITRIVSAVKTVPPVDAFEFIPGNSLNEFNDRLLAEGTENEDALLPGEVEYDENGETRMAPPPDFKLADANLAELAGGKFNPDVLEKQMHPQFAAALQTHKQTSETPQLSGTQQTLPSTNTNPTPTLSSEALQLAYLRLMNPYMFGGFPGVQTQQNSYTSSPVIITTDVTNTSTRVLRIIFNARPIFTTISTTEVVRTTITTYSTGVVTASPSLPGFGAFPFPAPLQLPGGNLFGSG